MKKNILFASLFALTASAMLISCDDDESEGLSRILGYVL